MKKGEDKVADNNLAVAEKTVFTEYPEQMDKYFQDRKLVVKTFPNRFQHIREAEFPDIEITSARQCYDFIEAELIFWNDQEIASCQIYKDHSFISTASFCLSGKLKKGKGRNTE